MMCASLRRGGMSLSVLLCALCVAISSVPRAGLGAEEKKSCRLSFAMPEGLVVHYEALSQVDQNFGGTDVRMNQTWAVDMSLLKKTEEGDYKLELKFTKTTSSVVQGTEILEWEPPVKLEGASIDPTVNTKGEVVTVEAGTNISGMRNSSQLKKIVEPFFVELPDTIVAVGETWKKEIEEGKRDVGEPEMKGTTTYTLKKIAKKGNLEVAVVEGKANLKLNQDTPAGILVGEAKGDIKALLAVEGGYIVEFKASLEVRGNTIEKDPLTDKETKRETAVTNYFECKMQH